MNKIAVTGYVNVSDELARWLLRTLTKRLPELIGSGLIGSGLHGITCLAKGTDQIFADVVLGLRGTFEVVLPARDYERRMIENGDADPFCWLLGQAARVTTMPFAESSRLAYLAASEAMLSECDLLLAVWDGTASADVGDTADVVRVARERGVPVEVLWPAGTRAATAQAG